MNNECGFEEKNIRAICDVGKSTKGKHKFGYIGKLIYSMKTLPMKWEWASWYVWDFAYHFTYSFLFFYKDFERYLFLPLLIFLKTKKIAK